MSKQLHENIVLYDKKFAPFIPYSEIKERVAALVNRMRKEYEGNNNLVFLVVLNGAFMFAAELLGELDVNGVVSFIKLSSYRGNSTTGVVDDVLGLDCNIEGRTVVIIEDIVDTGITMQHLLDSLKKKHPARVDIATMFFKPESFRGNYEVKFVAMELPKEFIVGFGLDYDGLGRNYKDIYKLVNERG